MTLMKYRFSILLVCFIWIGQITSAQVDYTSCIKNPSFESGKTDWVFKSMNTQDNTVFSIKEGSIYIEKWTGRGGAVGNGSVTQEITGLAPGNYQLTAVAQNIQEDTPQSNQTGAWIFAGAARTQVTVRDTYTVSFNYVSGSINIGFIAENASGNWISVDNFHLTLVGEDLKAELNEAIAAAVATLGDGSGLQNQQLRDAISAARIVYDDESATGQQQADAIIALEHAEDVYLQANASIDNPLDMTSRLQNPSFETGDLTGWTSQSMAFKTTMCSISRMANTM